ncbi:NAD-dependent epimerase/dehydratase [Thermogladius calderae 1633]|uniref:NAD-dependent epimerase/dehydratase n=1 Tax=Thermogladius calderae (strain DSM 22663 / VKM B-2946 / 1633) TaxID=1184251 RepID=I3TCW0_THEC1|nr:NAD-dependent epimerase/dehydratase family protein [Thermogladius calderae]AFK50598.1 NAD-dependent epimerase/dehydratase [Thermogladius calderae 1633]
MGRLILVTGGAGFIGSHLVDRLVLEGFRVRVVDNLSSGRLENLERHKGGSSVEIVVGDLKDPGVALKAVEGVETVFHFAANPEVRVSTTNPEVHFSENVVATFNLLEAMRRRGVRDLVFASSSSVYGEPDHIPVGEEEPVRPVSVYGASKAACENLMHAYSRLYGIRAVSLRYANIVGPRLRHGVIWDLINKLLANPRELEVLGDGTQTRSYLHVSEAVEATLLAWRRAGEGFAVYNVGNDDWITVNDVVRIVLSEMGLEGVKLVYKPVAHGVGWPGDVKRIALRIDKLKKLGFSPSMSSNASVSATVRSLLEEIDRAAPHG